MNSQRDTESVSDLAKRLIADGRAYATAEIDVYRQKALSYVPPIKMAAVLLVVALLLAQASITTLLIFIGFWLALWLGPLGGGIAATVIGLGVAGLLAYLAIRQFSGAGSRP